MDFLTENETHIIRNIIAPEHFIEDSFTSVSFGMDITLISGQLKSDSLVQLMLNPGRLYVQGVRFKKPTWSIAGALDWLKDNQKNFASDTETTQNNFDKKPKSIKAVEVFSAGKWNGDEFTVKDLDAMVAAFNKTKDHIPPFLKLGHGKEQKLLQAEGLPAAGWVEKLYRTNDKLMADFRDIPSKIYNLIEKGAYRKVSIELYQGLEILGDKFSHIVGAVAILGAETPGVMNLNDILARYGLKDYDKKIKAFTDVAESIKIYDYINKEKGGRMPDKDLIDAKAETKKLQDELAQAKTEAAKFKAAADTATETLEKTTKDLDETRKEFSANAEKLKQAEIGKQVAELEGAKLCSPAMKAFVTQLLDADKKEFSITKDNKEKEYSRFDLIKETLELAKATDVNFDNNSDDSQGESNKFSIEKVEAEIATYIEDNKVTYTTAYKAVIKKYESAKKTDVVEGDE